MLAKIYNALWYPALPFALLAAGGADRPTLRARLGITNYDSPASDQWPRIWLHAASVGEVEGIRPIMLAMQADLPHAGLFVTTMTAAGLESAQRRIPGAAGYSLAPLDHPQAVRSFLRRVKPGLVLVAETELWPNFFLQSARSGARILMINARISERSLRRYYPIRSLIGAALNHVSQILAQSEADADRFIALGAPRERIVITGNTKFDLPGGAAAAAARTELAEFIQHLGGPLFIAGSTAPGEESLVIEAYLSAAQSFPTLAMIIAPRHLERAAEVEGLLKRAAVPFVRATSLLQGAGNNGALHRTRVMLLDTIGDLRSLFPLATVAFVGGSMVPGRGGQNPGEPAAAAVPVLFGPFYENQQQIASALLNAGGARTVADPQELAKALLDLIGSPLQREVMSRGALAAVRELGGAVQRSLLQIRMLTNLS